MRPTNMCHFLKNIYIILNCLHEYLALIDGKTHSNSLSSTNNENQTLREGFEHVFNIIF